MDPLENLRKLQERIIETAEKMNLKVAGFALVPDRDPNGRDVLNLTFVLTPEAVESVEETTQRKTDDVFSQLMATNFDDLDIFATDEVIEAKQEEDEEMRKRRESMSDILKDFEDD